MLKPHRTEGFSLVELLVVVAIMGILMSIALPAFQIYIANNRVQSIAEVFVSGVMQAKGEAATLNRNVEFLLTTDGPNDVATAVGAANAAGWMIRTADLTTYLDGKLLSEDGQSAASIVGNTASVIFTPLGGTTLSAQAPPVPVATFDISSPADGDCRQAGGPIRCLAVWITASGRTKICNPAITTATDPRACS
jgi:type IV fimbrial biogenesis protein FimT